MALVHGIDASGFLQPLLLDANGQVLLSQPVQVLGTSSDKLLSFSNRLAYVSYIAALAAGYNDALLLTAPANTIYRVTSIAMVYFGVVTTQTINANVRAGGNKYYFYFHYSPVNGQFKYDKVDIYMNPGDNMYYEIANATLNDSAECVVLGYSFHTT